MPAPRRPYTIKRTVVDEPPVGLVEFGVLLTVESCSPEQHDEIAKTLRALWMWPTPIRSIEMWVDTVAEGASLNCRRRYQCLWADESVARLVYGNGLPILQTLGRPCFITVERRW